MKESSQLEVIRILGNKHLHMIYEFCDNQVW